MPEINKDKESLLTKETLKEVLHYDSDTGLFTWKISRGRVKVGDIAGSLYKTGYRFVKINGYQYLEHRLCFLYMEGAWPTGIVDHINRIKRDNRWTNLRHSTHKDNSLNRGKRRNVLPMSQKECRKRYHYCEETGVFTHKMSSHKGKRAGHKGKVGIQMECKGKSYVAHHLAFLYVTGEYPIGQVRHKDSDKFNNAWDNLELVCEKRSNIKGVTWNKVRCKWQAVVKVKGRRKYLGCFTEEADAIKAVEEYRLKHNLSYTETTDKGYAG